jgi:hypothetical protein
MSKKHEGTLADWLMVKGVEFHPNTVILDGTAFMEQTGESGASVDGFRSTPIFDYLFVEFGHRAVYFMKDTAIAFIRYNKTKGDKRYGIPDTPPTVEVSYARFLEFSPNGLFLRTKNGIGDILDKEDNCLTYKGLNLFHSLEHKGFIVVNGAFLNSSGYPEDDRDFFIEFFLMHALAIIAQCHLKRPIELIDYPPKSLQRIKRERGKEPSPFFMLKIDSTVAEKRYKNPPNKKDVSEKMELPMTWIRGHFMVHPANHPLPQFAGRTFWVPAHTRGDNEIGEVQKGYSIRLPKSKS